MIISNLTNYKPFVSNENSRATNNITPVLFQNALSDIVSKKELASNDNTLALCTDFNKFPPSQSCAMGKEKTENATQNENNEIAENEEKAKDIFTICFECENKEECEHYQKMINGDENVEGNAIFLPKKTSKFFHKNEVILQEQLYKFTGSSIIYNYNIICPDIDTKQKDKN